MRCSAGNEPAVCDVPRVSKYILVFAVLGGCSRRDARETTPSNTAAPATAEGDVSCEQVAENWGRVMAESGEDAQVRFADKQREVFARRCAADQWSIELKRCLFRVKSLGENGCSELATPEQEQALANDLMLMVKN